MPGNDTETTRDDVIRLARNIAGECQDVLEECEEFSANFPNEKPPDAEGFRVALHYAEKILNAAENGDEIPEAWFEPLTNISICDDK